MCSGGQVKPEYYPTIFKKLKSGLALNTNIMDEDIKTGFISFSVIIYCSEPVALFQFLHSLLSTQSPRTIIKATVNTIQSDDIKESICRDKLYHFYHDLDNIFNFQYGKILLATSYLDELEAMTAKKLPFFSHFSHDIEQCLSGGPG